MLSLILVVVVVSRIVYCKKRKKEILDSNGFVIALVLLSMAEGGVLGSYIGSNKAVKSIPERQEDNRVIESQMQELRNDFLNEILENAEQSKESFEVMFYEFIEEYNELKARFDENNEFIDTYWNIQEIGFPRTRFLLYFGH